mmetsp:Transcript_31302/g.36527  ORF Transcript_31302/g.36527 Transcript_31302/m.36527 type:complete len:200 (-) Transcript_31302:2332-2931(-)
MFPLLNDIILHIIQDLAKFAALRSTFIILTIPVLSGLLITAGLCTNFNFESDELTLLTPYNSKATHHAEWLNKHSNFTSEPNHIHILVHGYGRNILNRESINVTFQALDAVRMIPSYNLITHVKGVVNFFNDDYDLFSDTIQTDNDAIKAISIMPFLPNGNIVDRKEIFGYAEEDDSGLLTSVQSYSVRFLYFYTLSFI